MAKLYRFDKSLRRTYRGDEIIERASEMTQQAVEREQRTVFKFGLGWIVAAFSLAIAAGFLAAG